jgi:hypothetical protein
MVTDTRIPRCVFLADLPGGIRRCIIGDNQLKIRKCLPQQRVKRLGKILLPIVYGQSDAQSGRLGGYRRLHADFLYLIYSIPIGVPLQHPAHRVQTQSPCERQPRFDYMSGT